MLSLVNARADKFSAPHARYTGVQKKWGRHFLLRDNVILVHKGARFICTKVM